MKHWEDRAINAGLLYVTDFESGLTRRKCGKGFKFLDAAGKVVSCKITRQRIMDLVIRLPGMKSGSVLTVKDIFKPPVLMKRDENNTFIIRNGMKPALYISMVASVYLPALYRPSAALFALT